MSLTTTQTTTVTGPAPAEAMSDLQRRLQGLQPGPAPGAQQVRFRVVAAGPTPLPPTPSKTTTPNATLARRFSFVWPFISKENVAGSEPFLKSRCSQLLRQFPAFISGRQDESARTIRDLISRVLTQLKAVWLVLAVYLSVLVLGCLSSVVLYTFLLAAKPLGLWFLVACVVATGAIAGVSFTAKERPKQKPQRQQILVAEVPLQPQLQAPAPRITVN
ncbi:Cytochrome P450 monooxygenase TRI4 [Frankliniella fusca]|uniref:Cytochrome P450 monooxygenase TRI4 n=1 Tax=Frankliniella fusca TaxID=407009 RepID=A0AAE1H0I2_9NEOP|nr:Cytochrome P450 monooxygenase TRI4 [Frankliniella fusca]